MRPQDINVSSRDRDFRPTRRRGFDDDNFETPRRSFGSTPGSGAQRFEAPSGPPVQAVVKWYNPDKGFGFVQLADGSGDAFLHVSVVERSGHDSVPPGATCFVAIVMVLSALLSAPSRLGKPRSWALITRNSLTITPPHFRLGSMPDASREIT